MDKKKFTSAKEFINTQFKAEEGVTEILVGMGSCGIAAGANKVFNLFNHEVEKRGLKNVVVKKVGCLGLCFSEPNVEVKMAGLPDVLYGKVDEKFSLRILDEHLLMKNIINDNLYDKPYIDVLEIK